MTTEITSINQRRRSSQLRAASPGTQIAPTRASVLGRARARLGEWKVHVEQHAHQVIRIAGLDGYNGLTDALGDAYAQIALGDYPLILLAGSFSTGKSTVLSYFLDRPLPSGPNPTTRLFSVIQPVEGLEQSRYELVWLGTSDGRRFLDLLAKEIAALVPGGSELVRCEPDLLAGAESLYQRILNATESVPDEGKRHTLCEAAYLVRSLKHGLDPSQPDSWSRELTEEEVIQAVAAGTLRFQAKACQSREELHGLIEQAFSPGFLEGARAQYDAFDVASYERGLKIAAMAYLRAQVPANETLCHGRIIVDTPGFEANLHDTLKSKLVFQSATCGVVATRSSEPGGGNDDKLLAELQARLPKRYAHLVGRMFTFFDRVLEGYVTSKLLTDDGKVARSLVQDLVTRLELANEEAVLHRLLNHEDREVAAQAVTCFARFGCEELTDATKKVGGLVDYRAWLSEPRVREMLPEVARRVLERLDAKDQEAGREVPSPPAGCPSLRELCPGLAEPLLARLLGMLVVTGYDGGFDGISSQLAALQHKASELHARQFERIRERAVAALAEVEIGELAEVRSQLTRGQQQQLAQVRNAAGHAIREARLALRTNEPLAEMTALIEGPVAEVIRTELENALHRLDSRAEIDPQASSRALAREAFLGLVAQIGGRFEAIVCDTLYQAAQKLALSLMNALAPLSDATELSLDDFGRQLLARALAEPFGDLSQHLCKLDDALLKALLDSFLEVLDEVWHRCMRQADPLGLMPAEPYTPHHKRLVEQVTEEVCTRQAVKVFSGAVVAGMAACRGHVERQLLAKLDAAFDSAALQRLAAELVESGEEAEEARRLRFAQELIEEVQREAPALFDEVATALRLDEHSEVPSETEDSLGESDAGSASNAGFDKAPVLVRTGTDSA